MSALSVQNLSIQFGANTVLKNLSLDVNEGEFLVLLGPSGCGKSTLLHSIAGLNEVSVGSVLINGMDVTDVDPTDRGIGMVFQSYALYPNMTVERNLSFGLRVNGTPKVVIQQRVEKIAKMLQLQDLLHRKPSQLSGGQRQRVAIGRALAREARICLFDEPLSNLDAKLRAELRRELKLLHQSLGSTMVYVTHDQVEAMSLATRLVVMQQGQIQQIGTSAQVYEKPENLFVASFLGSPSMNLVQGHIHAEVDQYFFVNRDLRLDVSDYAFLKKPVNGHAVVLGVRPENVSLQSDKGSCQVKVNILEPMGNHQVVWFEMNSQQWASIENSQNKFEIGDTFEIKIVNDQISLFDSESEKRI
jgi:multiple sugar transport system ATP-binding protein